MSGARVVLVLGGGGARGLAHIGVLDVLARAGVRFGAVVGSSMGGLIGALSAASLSAAEIEEVARGFAFPSRFAPGGIVAWERIFRTAVPVLADRSFEALATPLLVTAVDLERGDQVVLHQGPVLPAIRATCAVPGVLPPERLDGRWLVDGGLVNVLPVDVAWTRSPEVVIAVRPKARRHRRLPHLDKPVAGWLSRVGAAKASFAVAVRAAEIVLDRAEALAAAMVGPEVLIEPEVGDIELRDFGRLAEAVAAGRKATEAALPGLEKLLAHPPASEAPSERAFHLRVDPVCTMFISPARAKASRHYDGADYYFCSPNCLDRFERDPTRYIGS
jgi:NTE family protein